MGLHRRTPGGIEAAPAFGGQSYNRTCLPVSADWISANTVVSESNAWACKPPANPSPSIAIFFML